MCSEHRSLRAIEAKLHFISRRVKSKKSRIKLALPVELRLLVPLRWGSMLDTGRQRI